MKYLWTILIPMILSHGALAGEPISVQDFVLDAKAYVGRSIEVSGTIICDAAAGEQDCSLVMPGAMSSQLDLDVSRLSRDDRKRMLGCSIENTVMNEANCEAIVSGRVVTTWIGPSLVASSMRWR
jgi:hypothetical protein